MLRNLVFGNLVYMYTPLGVLATLVGILIGGPWVWLGVAIFGANILIDTLTSFFHTKGAATTKEGRPAGKPWFLNGMMYAMLPIFVALQVAVAWRLYQYLSGAPLEVGQFAVPGTDWAIAYSSGITGVGLLGAVLSAAMHQGLGIMFGHELAHTKGFSFLISRWTMALSGAAHFCFAHVYNHHLELGRAWLGPENNKMGEDVDPATAPRGRSYYLHGIISHVGQSLFGYMTEKKRLKRLRKPFLSFSNRWIRGYLMSLPTVALFVGAGFLAGGLGGALLGLGVMLVIWVISNYELEALNYMEHYGLIRAQDEPIEYRHSWDNDNAFTSWAFIEIGRQADHHDRGETHFWELSSVGNAPNGAPNPGWGYYTEFCLALVPPLWHKIYRRKLAIWDRDFASAEERRIADEINKKVGYDVDPKEIEGQQMQVSYAL